VSRLRRRFRRAWRWLARPTVTYRPTRAARRGTLGRSLYVIGRIPQGVILFALLAVLYVLSFALMRA
jgi:hypothetical protein